MNFAFDITAGSDVRASIALVPVSGGGQKAMEAVRGAAWKGLPGPFGAWGIAAGACLAWASLAVRDGEHMAVIMMAIAAAAVISSLAGFAFSAICGAILFRVDSDPTRIVIIMMACSIANQAAMVWAVRQEVDWKGLGVHLAGGLPGLAVGIWILLHVDRSLYVHSFGAFLLAYGAILLMRKPATAWRARPALDVLTGFLGGITGGGAGFPGAFVTICCSMKGWSKARQRGLVQPFILAMQVTALAALSILTHGGAEAHRFDYEILLFVPASLAGTTLGLALYRRLTDRQFGIVVNVLLMCAGLSYVV
ncbi:MAG TPA: sulfite exporter TauE/SafE family protein [Candidatus Limnocylindria bacterium]|nr:sulfite exporter TauE/SafE family protein [Candidatus Limnocylindria bacterium]